MKNGENISFCTRKTHGEERNTLFSLQVGALAACFFAKRGYRVTVYEYRSGKKSRENKTPCGTDTAGNVYLSSREQIFRHTIGRLARSEYQSGAVASRPGGFEGDRSRRRSAETLQHPYARQNDPR